MKSQQSLWGIDLGGTKVEGTILKSAEEPEVLFRDRIATEANKGYDHIVSQVKAMFDLMAAHAGYRPDKIGIATPGALIPRKQVMKNCNTTALNGKPLKKDLIEKLGLPIEIANDANCFALAETKLGVVKQRFPDAQVVFGVILGTGVGGGIVVNGKIIDGHHGIGGEWGHNYLNPSIGYPCYCGKTGCNESILSGPALERFYAERAGKKHSLSQIVELAGKKNPAAVATVDRLMENFARAISVVINILDPDVIILGGGVGNVEQLYTDGVARIMKYIFNDVFEAPVVKPSLGDSAGVFGAAFLVA